MLPSYLRRAIGAVQTARPDDAMGDISVIFARREAEADRSVDALCILSSDIPRPVREFSILEPPYRSGGIPLTFERDRGLRQPGQRLRAIGDEHGLRLRFLGGLRAFVGSDVDRALGDSRARAAGLLRPLESDISRTELAVVISGF